MLEASSRLSAAEPGTICNHAYVNCTISCTRRVLVGFTVTWLCGQGCPALESHQEKVVHIIGNEGPVLRKGLFSKAVDRVVGGSGRGHFFGSESLPVGVDPIVC